MKRQDGLDATVEIAAKALGNGLQENQEQEHPEIGPRLLGNPGCVGEGVDKGATEHQDQHHPDRGRTQIDDRSRVKAGLKRERSSGPKGLRDPDLSCGGKGELDAKQQASEGSGESQRCQRRLAKGRDKIGIDDNDAVQHYRLEHQRPGDIEDTSIGGRYPGGSRFAHWDPSGIARCPSSTAGPPQDTTAKTRSVDPGVVEKTGRMARDLETGLTHPVSVHLQPLSPLHCETGSNAATAICVLRARAARI